MSAAIESLRTFAMSHNEIEFAHLCTAALNGEQWALDRLNAPMLKIGQLGLAGSPSYVEAKLSIILATDTTRPDGAIARSFEMP